MNTIDATVADTPAGPLGILAGPDGAVRAAGFTTDLTTLLALVHPHLHAPLRERRDLGPITAAVTAYLDGELSAVDGVPVEQHTDGVFLAHAWDILRDLKPGDPVTYTERRRALRPLSPGAAHRRNAWRLPLGARCEEVAAES